MSGLNETSGSSWVVPPRTGRQQRAYVLPRMLPLDRDLKAELATGWALKPYDPALQQDELTSLVEPAGDEPFVLHPGEFVLGSTLEKCTLPDDLAGRLEGKSSLGRLGLLTHSTAGFIDPGFSGHITLELSNATNLPITLWPGMRIGQLCLLRLS